MYDQHLSSEEFFDKSKVLQKIFPHLKQQSLAVTWQSSSPTDR